uniref:Reverse transcriptase zinc-binding domain-containing protein n=1 Tax=Cannabis sativa TaxID=3483 RepID=A0A803PSF7_CANSA
MGEWINNVYLKNTFIWSYDLKLDSSWYWNKLCRLKDKFSNKDIMVAGAGGKFRTNWLYNSLIPQQQFHYNSSMWSSLNVPKHRFMLWQVVNIQLLTRDKLEQFYIELDTKECHVCGLTDDSQQHLFFSCCLSRRVADLVFEWLGSRYWPTDFERWRAYGSIGIDAYTTIILIRLEQL